MNRALRLALLVAFVVASGACGKGSPRDESPADAAVDTAPSVDIRPAATTCTKTGLEAMGPACIPRFDKCGPRELPKLGGGCLAIGVPTCATGFVADGEGGCRATLPAGRCAEGTMALPGDDACRLVAPCGEGTWGDIATEADTLFVDAAFVGTGDGSKTKPFTKIADALAVVPVSTRPIVAVAAGTYAEDLILERPVRLIGRCPSMATIRGTTVAITAHAYVEVRALAITSAGRGLLVESNGDAFLAQAWVHHCADFGVGGRDKTGPAIVRLDHVLVEANAYAGVVGTGAVINLRGVVVRDSKPLAGVGGEGIVAAGSTATGALGQLIATGSVVEGNVHAGIAVAGARVTVDATVVRDTVLGTEGGFGIATTVDEKAFPSTLRITGSLIERGPSAGLFVRHTATVVERTVIRDGKPMGTGLGRGIDATANPLDGTQLLVVRDSLIAGNSDRGIRIREGDATIERTIVRDTKLLGEGQGCGICAERVDDERIPTLRVLDTIVRDNAHIGLGAYYGVLDAKGVLAEKNGAFGVGLTGAKGRFERLIVRDSQPSVGGHKGNGVLVNAFRRADGMAQRSELTLIEAAIEGSRGAGVVVFSSSAILERVVVRDTLPTLADGLAGFGVLVQPMLTLPLPTTLIMQDVLIQRSVIAGLAVDTAVATVTHAWIVDTRANDMKKFGDGIIAIASLAGKVGSGAMVSPAELTLDDVWVENSARAGVAVFASKLKVGRTAFMCNGFHLDVETAFDEPPAPVAPFTIDEGVGNVCGCGKQAEVCRAQSTGLTPVRLRD